jgi:hypothetical protein
MKNNFPFATFALMAAVLASCSNNDLTQTTTAKKHTTATGKIAGATVLEHPYRRPKYTNLPGYNSSDVFETGAVPWLLLRSLRQYAEKIAKIKLPCL